MVPAEIIHRMLRRESASSSIEPVELGPPTKNAEDVEILERSQRCLFIAWVFFIKPSRTVCVDKSQRRSQYRRRDGETMLLLTVYELARGRPCEHSDP